MSDDTPHPCNFCSGFKREKKCTQDCIYRNAAAASALSMGDYCVIEKVYCYSKVKTLFDRCPVGRQADFLTSLSDEAFARALNPVMGITGQVLNHLSLLEERNLKIEALQGTVQNQQTLIQQLQQMIAHLTGGINILLHIYGRGPVLKAMTVDDKLTTISLTTTPRFQGFRATFEFNRQHDSSTVRKPFSRSQKSLSSLTCCSSFEILQTSFLIHRTNTGFLHRSTCRQWRTLLHVFSVPGSKETTNALKFLGDFCIMERVFSYSKVSTLFSRCPVERQVDFVTSLAYEANARAFNPIMGRVFNQLSLIVEKALQIQALQGTVLNQQSLIVERRICRSRNCSRRLRTYNTPFLKCQRGINI